MRDPADNAILVKSKAFALRCVKAYQYLTDKSNYKSEYVLSKQMLRSGTSIGANVREGVHGQTKADFGSKMNIALKEANETMYWLELLTESGYITDEQGKSMMYDCEELIKLLASIVKTTFTK